MEALKILKEELEELRNRGQQYSYIREKKKKLKEAIEELEELIAKDKSKNCEECYNKTKLAIENLENRSCNGCKYLKSREELLKHSCLIEVCRSCKRSNIDNWEQK